MSADERYARCSVNIRQLGDFFLDICRWAVIAWAYHGGVAEFLATQMPSGRQLQGNSF